MSAECPLDYIKSVRCPGPVDMGKGRYICARQDGECQNRLNARVFEASRPTTFEAPPEDQTFNFNYREP